MPDNTPRTCQGAMFFDDLCGRPLFHGDMCICHSEREDKDVKLFQVELDRILADESSDYIDLTNFVFPVLGWRLPKKFKKDVHFGGAKFLGGAYFNGSQFSGEAQFVGAEFKGQAHFEGTKFLGDVYFMRAQFSGEANFRRATFLRSAGFRSARFADIANFGKAIFKGEAEFFDVLFFADADFWRARFSADVSFARAAFHARASFWGAVVSDELLFDQVEQFGHTEFVNLRFHGPGKLVLRRVKLQKSLFSYTDCASVRFYEVEWPERRTVHKKIPLTRMAVADELESGQGDWGAVADIYAGLEASYLNRGRHREAGQFYVAHQDVLRKVNRKWSYLIVNSLYRWFALFGTSYIRPLFWLAAMFLIVPAILLRMGMKVEESLNYDLTSLFGTLRYVCDMHWNGYWTRYCDAFALNLSFVSFGRGEIAEYLTEPWERALVSLETLFAFVLVTFLVLALRRLFKRRTV